MQWQLPLNELRNYTRYMEPNQYAVMRFSTEDVIELRFENTKILLSVDPETTEVNLKSDEIKSTNRIQAAAPADIKVINLTRPATK